MVIKREGNIIIKKGKENIIIKRRKDYGYKKEKGLYY